MVTKYQLTYQNNNQGSAERCQVLSKGIFPSGNFPRVFCQVVTSQMCSFSSGNFASLSQSQRSAAACSNNRGARSPSPFQLQRSSPFQPAVPHKLPLEKQHIWEVSAWEFDTWEDAFWKVPRPQCTICSVLILQITAVSTESLVQGAKLFQTWLKINMVRTWSNIVLTWYNIVLTLSNIV